MTGDMDPFTIIDFMLVDSFSVSIHMTVEEVLTPAVVALGGATTFVKLTTVCQQAQVLNYFRATGRMWDFSDFETYFHAHDEMWEYEPMQTLLRLRSAQERITRLAPSQKRDSGSEDPGSVQCRKIKQAKIAPPVGPPTTVVLLCNLVGAGEVDDDLQEETADEARTYGELRACKIKELSGAPDDQAVRVFLNFATVEAAEKAANDMNGRFFAGRTVRAHYYDEQRFTAGHLDDNLKAPLPEFCVTGMLSNYCALHLSHSR